MTSVSIIGCGNMGGAIAKALLEANTFDLTLYDSENAKAAAFGAKTAKTLKEALSASSLIILAVKPQVIDSLYDEISEYKDKDFISILAGVPLEVLEYRIGADNIARFMPNLAAGEKKAVTAVAFSSDADKDFKKLAFEVAGKIGSAFELSEKLFPAFIGISGSGIAYIFQLVHALAMGGVQEGLPYTSAVKIATATLESAACLLTESKANPVELATRVCSAGGTTIRGMNTLSEGGFDAAITKAVIAAGSMSRELERLALEKLHND